MRPWINTAALLERYESCKSKDVSTMATFTENTWLLKKIAGVARYDPGVSMGQMPNASIYQSPWAPKELTSPNRW
jgi:hypothetical protein